MSDKNKTRQQLLTELKKLRKQVTKLESVAVKSKKATLQLEQERAMFMHGSVMTFTWRNSENWPVEQVSENVLNLLGYSAREFLDGSLVYAELIHPDDVERVSREVAKKSQSDVEYFIHGPYRLIKKNQEILWVLDTTTIIRDSLGITTHFQGYLVDISSSIRMKEEFLQAKTRLELAINGANLGIWDWDIESGLEIFNDRWAEILGYQLEEIEQDFSSWHELIHPEDADEVATLLTEHLEGHTPVYMTEHRLRHKSGTWIWILSVGKVSLWDDAGNPLRASCIHLDITKRKQAEEELQRSKNLLQGYLTAIDSIGMGLLVIDADYRVQDMNSTMINWFGDQRGRICHEAFGENDALCSYCKLTEVIGEGKTVRYRPASPAGRIFDRVAVPVETPDGALHKLEIVYDITGREEAKLKLLELNNQLAKSLNDIQELSASLESRVQRQTREIQQNYHRLKETKQEIKKKNIALQVLVDRQRGTREELAQHMATRLKKLVYPYLELLQEDVSNDQKNECLAVIKMHLDSIVKPVDEKQYNPDWQLTPREVLVADLVRQGKNTKEIGKMLNISPRTAERYRNNIRKKIGLTDRKMNLHAYLNSEIH